MGTAALIMPKLDEPKKTEKCHIKAEAKVQNHKGMKGHEGKQGFVSGLNL